MSKNQADNKNKHLSLLPYSAEFLKNRANYNYHQYFLSFAFSSTFLATGSYIIYHTLKSAAIIAFTSEIAIPIVIGTLLLGVSYLMFQPAFDYYKKYSTFKELSKELTQPLEHSKFIQKIFPCAETALEKAFIHQHEIDNFITKTIKGLTTQVSDDVRIKIKDKVVKEIIKSKLITPIKLLTRYPFPPPHLPNSEIADNINESHVMNWTAKLVLEYANSPAFSYAKLNEVIISEAQKQNIKQQNKGKNILAWLGF